MSVHRTGKALAALIADVVWLALALQFYLMVIGTPAQGAARMRLLFNYFYFSFFTILTNLIVAVGLTLSLSKTPLLG